MGHNTNTVNNMKSPPLILLATLVALAILAPGVSADPIAPLTGPNQSYHYALGDDRMEIFVGVPLTAEEEVYPEAVFYIFVLAGLAFIVLAVVFLARSDNVPSIALMICGGISAMLFLASAEMAPLVGSIDTFYQVVANVSNSGATPEGVINTIYITQVITFQLTPWMAYVAWAGFVLGILVLITGVLSLFGVLQNWVEKWREGRLKKTGILEMDQDPDNL